MKNIKDLEINNILDLQIALMEDNNSAIKGYVERLDRETSNAAMRRAGKHFGFPTVEIEGVVRTNLRHLMRVFGYKRLWPIRKLLEERGIYGIKLGDFEQNTQSLIQEALHLDPSDYSALSDWTAFLIGGISSTNEEARIVQTYFLSGYLTDNLPETVHAMVKCKLAKEAWSGNPIASYVFEHDYGISAKMLALAGSIVQHLQFIVEDKIILYGLTVFKKGGGFAIEGREDQFYNTFREVNRRHHLHRFFWNPNNLDRHLLRGADVIETLGWRRCVLPRRNGYLCYRYEQYRQIAAADTKEGGNYE